MQEQHKILIVGRSRADLDSVASALEAHGYLATSTDDDDIAIDLIASAEFDALLMDGMTQKDQSALRGETLKRRPKIKLIAAEGAGAALTLLRQALRA